LSNPSTHVNAFDRGVCTIALLWTSFVDVPPS
jgi:hypothetical protein